ncbi:nicotinic acid mononucleotide adenylyltransferase [Halalkalibacillus sediminis]|uniref:Probable nicotinate-nucleotide adenylyltransferase n=1 Tax=Halalkalibacillus sediminis TaxID=2018042 RepID=A0A2I0QXL4_9BACI|nr:nicotinate-nucleotide adenylyltransferase [Halalkalibacillus sediminis]PKR79059.1 nicotinic acid mononucleotide adenylyltransferase [Halalkalibacillus sediminis]
MKKIGLFGGTFDPPHIGHIQLVKTVLESLELDEVWLIPTYTPPHKEGARADSQHRLNMLRLLIDGEDQLSISTIEYKREGKSYTLDTVKELKKLYPKNQFYFIIGGDMIDYLPKWHRIDELKQLIQFVGVQRKGYNNPNDQDVLIVEMPPIEVSSTDIRENIKLGRVPVGLPDSVREYIKENHLYED